MVESFQRAEDPTPVEQQSVCTPWSQIRPLRDLIGRLVDAGADLTLDTRSGGVIALRRSGRHWNALGQRDALGSILTRADGGTGWDLHEFFETGRADVARLMAEIKRLLPTLQTHRALDFGCGVGRVTQALRGHFDEVIGVDVADSMIALARAYARAPALCQFEVNRTTHLRRFAGDTFDLVYSRLVLQHIPPRLMRRYIQELLRLLAPGGLFMFQLPTEIDDPKQAFCNAPVLGGQLKRNLPSWLVRAHRQVKYAIHRSMVPHMEMFGMAQDAVVELVEGAGGEIVAIQPDRGPGTNVPGFEYWVTTRSSGDFQCGHETKCPTADPHQVSHAR